MRTVWTALCALGVLALSACGGGGSSGGAVPAGSAPGSIDPNGSTVAFQSGSLWVASNTGVREFSTDDNGAATPRRMLGDFPWPAAGDPGPVDVAVAPDGTLWVLVGDHIAFGSSKWMVFAYPPGATDAHHLENSFHGTGGPAAFGLGGDGVLVGTSFGPNGDGTIQTYPYASTDAPPMRTFSVSPGHRGSFTMGYNSRIYLARADGFESYRPDSNGCCPVQTVVTSAPPENYPGSFAVGPDSSIYATNLVGFHQPGSHGAVAYVNVYPPSSGTPARRIGPIAIDNGPDALGPRVVVDAQSRLYLGQSGTVYRFGATANGNAVPERTVTFLGNVYGLAIGP
jgi:hypothetical protein